MEQADLAGGDLGLVHGEVDRFSEEDLPRLGHSFDPGRDVDGLAEDVVVGEVDLPGVYGDAHLDALGRGAARVARSEGFLHRDPGQDRVRGALIDHEEGVADGLDELASLRFEQGQHDALMFFEQGLYLGAALMRGLVREALDVGEQDGEVARQRGGHGGMVSLSGRRGQVIIAES